jgi:cytochrome c oxidase subunit 2
MFRYLPEQASDIAHKVDWIHNWVTDISVFFTVAIVGTMLYYAIRYRQRDGKDHETPRIEGDHTLEIIWTVVPTIICIFIAIAGLNIHREMRTPPADTLDIQVWAKQWAWRFEYPNGEKTYNQFTVPIGKPVKFIMKSEDVLHSFFIPEMRVKSDVLPNMFTYVWFRPIKVGSYTTYCTEYCGKDHSAMLASANVVSEAEYDRWLNDNTEELIRARSTPAQVGYKLYSERGCNACHSLNGVNGVGPSFKDLWGKDESLKGGEKVKVDENYLHESILNPNAKVVEGYNPIMPAFEGQLSEDEVAALIAFIKDIDVFAAKAAATQAVAASAEPAKDPASMTPEERGKEFYNNQANLCVTCHSLDGSARVGPSFQAIYGRQGKLADGTEYVADDAYIKRSILKPQEQVVEGFAPSMPAYEGRVTDEQLNDIIAFMKTLK